MTTTKVEPVYFEDYPTHFLVCRTFGHGWEEYVAVGMGTPSFGFRYSLFCGMCGTQRHDIVNTFGTVERSARTYRYPDGYQGLQANRDECRLELIQRERPIKQRPVARRGQLARHLGEAS